MNEVFINWLPEPKNFPIPEFSRSRSLLKNGVVACAMREVGPREEGGSGGKRAKSWKSGPFFPNFAILKINVIA